MGKQPSIACRGRSGRFIAAVGSTWALDARSAVAVGSGSDRGPVSGRTFRSLRTEPGRGPKTGLGVAGLGTGAGRGREISAAGPQTRAGAFRALTCRTIAATSG